MGGGLLQLVAYGAQDVYLTGNPQITFFKVVYRRHTNFALESIEQSFNGSTNIGSRVSVLVTRNGDLINRVYFSATLRNSSTETSDGDDDNGIALVPYFGLRLLKNIELEIGGQRIDKHYSEWMYIWNELSLPQGKKEGYDAMVGGSVKNTCTRLSAERFGGTATQKAARLLTCKRDIIVPLEFWFCRNVGLALPLIALQYHEVKINIEFSEKKDLVDNHQGNFCYDYSGANKETNDNNHADNKGGVLVLENVQLWVDYIFLDTDERRRFAQLSHEYLIEQLQFTGSEKIDGGTSLRNIKMNFNHPCKELIWTIKPDSEKPAAAAAANAINGGVTVAVAGVDSTPFWNNFTDNAYNQYNHDEGIVNNSIYEAKMQLNGNDRFAQRSGDYFSIVQPFQHHENTPNNYRKGINVYSFALKPEEHQPSGTLNMSRIDTAHLQIASRKEGLISIYAINYNVLRILSGMGGLAYSN